jgi:hypothetical protein
LTRFVFNLALRLDGSAPALLFFNDSSEIAFGASFEGGTPTPKPRVCRRARIPVAIGGREALTDVNVTSILPPERITANENAAVAACPHLALRRPAVDLCLSSTHPNHLTTGDLSQI